MPIAVALISGREPPMRVSRRVPRTVHLMLVLNDRVRRVVDRIRMMIGECRSGGNGGECGRQESNSNRDHSLIPPLVP